MGTPLYTTDVIPMTSRPTLTVMDDGDYFLIFDTSTAKISKILKTNVALPASQASYDNATSGLTATQVQAALDELVVNLGSSDSAISALAGRLDTLEGTGAGSVSKAIDDAVSPIDERLTGLDTLTYEGKTYMVSKRIEDGHLVTTYTEV